MSKNYSLNVQDDGIAFLTLSHAPVNALSIKLIDELTSVFRRLSEDSNINILIISSSIKHFCAGADLKERKSLSIKETENVVSKIGMCFLELEKLPFPTISAIQGTALGGGLELALACDFRIADENAIIGLTETSLGIIPGAGGTQRLPRLIGKSKAKYWIFSARKFSAEEAFIDGVVDFLSPSGEVLETAIDLADEINQNAPIAIKAAKKSIDEGIGRDFTESLSIEKQNYKTTLHSNDRNEALEAFAEKRSPKWSGN